MQVKEIPVAEVKVHNRARVEKGDIEGLAKTIQEKGLIQPITVDPSMRLIAGERRLEAHKLLGLKLIPAIIRRIEGQVDADELELIENIARKDLNWPERAKLEKKILDFYRKKDASFSQRNQAEVTGDSRSAIGRRIQLAEAIDLLPELAECETEDEAWKIYKKLEENEALKFLKEQIPENVANAIRNAAEHYQVGDAFEGMAATSDSTFDFAEVDSPFGVDLDKRKSRNKDDDLMEEYNEWDDFEALFTRTAKEVYRLLKPNSFAVFWYGMSWHTEVLHILREVGFGVPDIPAIWTKGGAGQTAQPFTTFGNTYDPFFLARKGQPKMPYPGRGNTFDYKQVARKVHPTEKPVALIKEILHILLDPGASIVIPFLGSGVTLRAAYTLGHTGIGWDLSQSHKEGFLKRIAEDEKAREAQRQELDELEELEEEIMDE